MNILSFIPLYPDPTLTVEFMVVGFTLVCIVLWGLAGITQITGILFRLFEARAAKIKADALEEAKKILAEQAAAQPAAAPATGAKDPRILAVISAAVFSVLGGAKHKIVSVTPSKPDASWAQSGRQSVFSSHTPKKD